MRKPGLLSSQQMTLVMVVFFLGHVLRGRSKENVVTAEGLSPRPIGPVKVGASKEESGTAVGDDKRPQRGAPHENM
jgi:hypothetical protein